ncbi:MAG: protein-glutamate O-methyltransferase [Syntrophobacteraceae bacterium]
MQQETVNNLNVSTTIMSEKVFRRLSGFIHGHCGIKMPPVKKQMLEGRLRKRLRALNVSSFESYCDYVFKTGAETELIHMIDAVTTNKTDFFREPAHFDYLLENILPELSRSMEKISIWSAGCSSGEEPYTIAMILSEFAQGNKINFSILATDISARVLEQARRAIYDHERIEPVPIPFREKYLLRGKDDKGLVRIKPELRSQVHFRRLNLMDAGFGMLGKMCLIFCRNVMIYFDRNTQEELLGKFCRQLVPGGYLFTGHSETIQGMDLPLVPFAPTIHKRV